MEPSALVQAFLAAAQVIVVIARPTGHLAAVDLDDAGRQRAQEFAVVGDEHHAAAEVLQEFLEPGDRLDIQMVGRLVQQQHVRRLHQRLAEQHAPLHAARERREFDIGGKLQARDHFLHAPLQLPAVPGFDARLHLGQRAGVDVMGMAEAVVLREQRAQLAQTGGDDIEHQARHRLRHFLRETGDLAAEGAHLAIVRADLPGHQPHQGGFAGAVAADDADALVGFDGEIDLFEQERTADAVVDILEIDEGHRGILQARRGDKGFMSANRRNLAVRQLHCRRSKIGACATTEPDHREPHAPHFPLSRLPLV